MNQLQESIAKCTVSGNTVLLPKELLDNYADVRTAMLKAGATYKKNSFVFPNAAQQYVDRLLSGDSVNRQKETQFFATPPDLADYLVELAEISNHDMVLEPSAGQGAIVKAIHRAIETKVHCCENDEINVKALTAIPGVLLVCKDFMNIRDNMPVNGYDVIIANPPFTKNKDIEHINHMYIVARKGGRIVSVASKHWQFAADKKCEAFRMWLDAMDARVIDLEAGRFKSSGTMVASCIIVINK